MQLLKELVKKVDSPDILNRIIPQIYSLSEYELVRNIYEFPEIYLTLYKSSDSNEEVIQFIDQHPLGAIVCATDIFEKRKEVIVAANKKEVPVYIHTINSMEELKKYENYEIDGIYTDFLRENKKGLFTEVENKS